MANTPRLSRNSRTSSITDMSIWKDKEMQIDGDSRSDSKEPSSIWKQMSYVPPRGPCGFKFSLVSPSCPCLRFMLHPTKITSSFECDGCGHHASFHAMRSKSEDSAAARAAAAVATRWQREDGTFDHEAYELDEQVQEILAKRRRLGIEGAISSNRVLGMPEKARSTLVETGKKRTRAGMSST